MYDASYWDIVWSRGYERYNRRHQEIWSAVMPFMKGNVADLGCGPCAMYEAHPYPITGVDWSENALVQAKMHNPKGTYIKADARNTGFLPMQFDTVLMFGLLDYFENWDDVLKEARRIAKPGGKIVATLLHGFEGHDWTKYPLVTGNWRLYTETV